MRLKQYPFFNVNMFINLVFLSVIDPWNKLPSVSLTQELNIASYVIVRTNYS